MDSPVEEDGFEPLVPREKGRCLSRRSDRPPAPSPPRIKRHPREGDREFEASPSTGEASRVRPVVSDFGGYARDALKICAAKAADYLKLGR
jgi:hypothetical protein